jgi:hypothetical protein
MKLEQRWAYWIGAGILKYNDIIFDFDCSWEVVVHVAQFIGKDLKISHDIISVFEVID